MPFPEGDAIPLLRRVPRRPWSSNDATARPSFGSLEGYIAGRLTADVLARAGARRRRESFLAALAEIGTFDIGGFALQYGPRDNRGSDQVFLTVIRGRRHRAGRAPHAMSLRRHRRRRPRRPRLGLSTKLYVAIAGAVALTLAASVVAWISFVELGQLQRRITREHIPSITDSLRLARQTALIVATTPALVSAADERNGPGIMTALRAPTAGHRPADRCAREGRSRGAPIPDAARLIARSGKPAASCRSLDRLDKSVARQLALRTELAERRDQAVELHRRLIEKLIPLLDDATMFLVTGYRNLDEVAPVPQKLRLPSRRCSTTPRSCSSASRAT